MKLVLIKCYNYSMYICFNQCCKNVKNIVRVKKNCEIKNNYSH